MRQATAWAWLVSLAMATGSELASIDLQSIDGEVVRPGDPGSGPFAVMVFVTTDCPIANAFQPELRRLEARARELGGAFTLVEVVPDVSEDTVRRHAKEFGITTALVIDREHRLVQATGAEMTPEAVVVAASGEIAYQGRISDLFVAYGKRRNEATEHNLRDAMEALSEGRAVPVRRTEALGCYIPVATSGAERN